jgi:hypothetical protein
LLQSHGLCVQTNGYSLKDDRLLPLQQAKEELKDLELWRKGPVGKLHNIVKYICWSGQREQLFEKLQEIEISSLPDDHPIKKIYKLVEDQDTRWNS